MNEDKVESAAVNKPAFCNACGNQLPEEASFCPVCGQWRAQVAPFVAAQADQANLDSTPRTNTFDYSPENPLPPSGYPVYAHSPSRREYLPWATSAMRDHQLPRSMGECSRKDFIEKYAEPSLKKNITSIAILCYVCAGVTFVASCLSNPWGIIDALVLAAFALGMHLAKSRACAISILILSIVEVVLSLAAAGSFPFWWLVAGISAVVTFAKIERQYKEFITCLDGRRRPPNKNC